MAETKKAGAGKTGKLGKGAFSGKTKTSSAKQYKTSNKGGNNKGNGERPYGRKPVKPLKALTPNQIRRQAKQTAVSSFKPGRTQLKNEEQRLNAQQEKRRADGEKYRSWLDERSAQFELQGQAAGVALQQAQQEREQMRATALMAQENTNLDQAKAQSTSYSNAADSYSLQTDARAAHEARVSEKQANDLATVNMNNEAMTAAMSQNVMAQLAGMNAQSESEYASASRDLKDARMKLEDEQRALFVSAKDKLQDRELDKAVKRSDIKVQNRKLGLEKAGLKLEYFKASNDLKIAMANNASDERIAALNNEAKRLAAQINAAGSGGKGGKEPDMTDVRARKKTTREINASISTVISSVQGTGALHRMWKTNDLEGLRAQIVGSELASPYLVPIIFDFMKDGKLSPASKSTLRGVGAYVKHVNGTKVKRPHRGGPGDAHGG